MHLNFVKLLIGDEIMKDVIQIQLPQVYVYDHVGVRDLRCMNHLGRLPIKIVPTINPITYKRIQKLAKQKNTSSPK